MHHNMYYKYLVLSSCHLVPSESCTFCVYRRASSSHPKRSPGRQELKARRPARRSKAQYRRNNIFEKLL